MNWCAMSQRAQQTKRRGVFAYSPRGSTKFCTPRCICYKCRSEVRMRRPLWPCPTDVVSVLLTSAARDRAAAPPDPVRSLRVHPHVPENRGWEVQHAPDLLAIERRREVLAPRHVGHLVIGQELDLLGDLLALAGIGGTEPVTTQLLHLLAARPPEPRLVAGAREPDVHGGVVDVGGDPGGVHEVPTAGRRRLLLRAPGDDRAPVERHELHLRADLLELVAQHETA